MSGTDWGKFHNAVVPVPKHHAVTVYRGYGAKPPHI